MPQLDSSYSDMVLIILPPNSNFIRNLETVQIPSCRIQIPLLTNLVTSPYAYTQPIWLALWTPKASQRLLSFLLSRVWVKVIVFIWVFPEANSDPRFKDQQFVGSFKEKGWLRVKWQRKENLVDNGYISKSTTVIRVQSYKIAVLTPQKYPGHEAREQGYIYPNTH